MEKEARTGPTEDEWGKNKLQASWSARATATPPCVSKDLPAGPSGAGASVAHMMATMGCSGTLPSPCIPQDWSTQCACQLHANGGPEAGDCLIPSILSGQGGLPWLGTAAMLARAPNSRAVHHGTADSTGWAQG